jgi:putative DNA methylase
MEPMPKTVNATSPRHDDTLFDCSQYGANAPCHAPAPIGDRLIEVPGSLLALDAIAEAESWRKEVHRPIYHMHKWWAQRLGSVFRGLAMASLSAPSSSLHSVFYEPVRFDDTTVFDPFMGSGTSLGEAFKLGCSVVGMDINPVACAAVNLLFDLPDRSTLLDAYKAVERTVSHEIREMYSYRTPSGVVSDVLYYFWVKVVSCPKCATDVSLFSSYIFARHAYPKRYPAAKAICKHCGEIASVNVNDATMGCEACGNVTDLAKGNASGQKAYCAYCKSDFVIHKAVSQAGFAPRHKMYAKMVLDESGKKRYLRATDEDLQVYKLFAEEAAKIRVSLSDGFIEPGYNTNQVLRYRYRAWHEFFNDRQLVALDKLARAIAEVQDSRSRLALGVLFSGVLEFNNMFASFKGEGTGAVRHMFSHHILKPERMPLEANVWGTPRSSGSFSTLFERRLLKALEYAEHPWEIRLDHSNETHRVFNVGRSFSEATVAQIAQSRTDANAYIDCGDAALSRLADASIDLVLTDPPFFDNVHYSELADFFWVWQRRYGFVALGADHAAPTTRSDSEVQHTDHGDFSVRLARVFMECRRVLKKNGLLVFTFHHSDDAGWFALADALIESGFSITQTHSVKAEMSVASPKTAASDPIDRDIVIVARQSEGLSTKRANVNAKKLAKELFHHDVQLLNGRLRSDADRRNLFASKVLIAACQLGREDRKAFINCAIGESPEE